MHTTPDRTTARYPALVDPVGGPTVGVERRPVQGDEVTAE